DGLSGMIRADEMREVLLNSKEPFDACRELIDRATRAGGHDNITVIVIDFDGQGLPAPNPSDELAYRKYTLPEAPAADATARALPVPAQLATAAASDEAQRESRRLKVGHTMVGVSFQLPGPEAQGQAQAAAPRIPSNPPQHYEFGEDPVQLPTSGVPPSLVGFMVLGAMIVVALAGFLLLR
ncbi:MAG TPA: hypothetical protein VGP93_08435, partial [Polyangiaceae bacterium]|nr:hypothetical protein [Polyangiaceae bacterium]